VNLCYDTAKNWRISSNISGYSGPIFAVFSPYESAFGVDDRSGPRFQICQGTLRINSSDDQATSNINLVGF